MTYAATSGIVTLTANHRFGRHVVTDFTGSTLQGVDGVTFTVSGGTPAARDTVKGLDNANLYNDTTDAAADSLVEGTDVIYKWTTFTVDGTNSVTGWLFQSKS